MEPGLKFKTHCMYFNFSEPSFALVSYFLNKKILLHFEKDLIFEYF